MNEYSISPEDSRDREELTSLFRLLTPKLRGALLLRLRKENAKLTNKHSQKDFAEQIGITQSSLSKYENGKPPAERLADFALRSDIPIGQIRTLTNDFLEKNSKERSVKVALSHNIHCSPILVAAKLGYYDGKFSFSSTREKGTTRDNVKRIPWSINPIGSHGSVDDPGEAMFTEDWISSLKKGYASIAVGTPASSIARLDEIFRLGILCFNKRSKVSVFYRKNSRKFKSADVNKILNPEYEHHCIDAKHPPEGRHRDRFYYRFLKAFGLADTGLNESIHIESKVPVFVRDMQVSAFDFDNFQAPWKSLFERYDINDGKDYVEIARTIKGEHGHRSSKAKQMFGETDVVCVVYWEPYSSYYFSELGKSFKDVEFERVDLKSSLFYERRSHEQVPVEIIGNRNSLSEIEMEDIILFFQATQQGVDALVSNYKNKNTDSQLLRDLAKYFGLSPEKYIEDLKTHIYDMEVFFRVNALQQYKAAFAPKSI